MATSSTTSRVFELAPAVERAPLHQGEKIETLELCVESLYVGTSQGRLVRFRLREDEETAGGGGRTAYSAVKVAERSLGPKSPVTFVRSASALSRLLVLCDGTLSVLSANDERDPRDDGREDLTLLPLSGSSKLRGVQACCVNENPVAASLSSKAAEVDPFAVQMCLAKKKQVAVINITEIKLIVERICDLPEQVSAVSMDGSYVCAALSSHYVILNVSTGESQDLFPFTSTPTIARVAKEEFLLGAPGGLGMFVTSAGVSERPPIQWERGKRGGGGGQPQDEEGFDHFVYHSPHVVALGEEGIAVYR